MKVQKLKGPPTLRDQHHQKHWLSAPDLLKAGHSQNTHPKGTRSICRVQAEDPLPKMRGIRQDGGFGGFEILQYLRRLC